MLSLVIKQLSADEKYNHFNTVSFCRPYFWSKTNAGQPGVRAENVTGSIVDFQGEKVLKIERT
jgi:hypothetical protein